MTAPQARNADGLNASGNGRGIRTAVANERGKRVPKRGINKNTEVKVVEARARGIDTGTIAGAESIDPDKPLTDLQKAFVYHWAHGETILSASVKAGYVDGGTYAYRLCRMPNIIRLYNQEKAKYEEAAQMSRKKVMDMLLESYEAAKILSEPASMVSAAREIGKMCGYYEPVKVKHEINIEGKLVVDRLSGMSDSELLDFIAQQAVAMREDTPRISHDSEDRE